MWRLITQRGVEIMDFRKLLALAACLLFAGCSAPAPTGPWSRAYQMKWNDGTEVNTDGLGHMYIMESKKDENGHRQISVFDFPKKMSYLWAEGSKGYMCQPLKEEDGVALYFSKASLEAMSKNSSAKKLDDKTIAGCSCKGFEMKRKIPGFGGFGFGGFRDRDMSIDEVVYVNPEFEVPMERGINGSALTVTSFTGSAPDSAVFGPALGTSSMANFTEQNETTRKNMNVLKQIVDMYSSAHEGNFPPSAEDLHGLLCTSPEQGFMNPCNGKREFPIPGGVGDVRAARNAKPKTMVPGVIEYTLLPGGRGYAIVGGDARGYALSTADDKPNTTLVVSNVI